MGCYIGLLLADWVWGVDGEGGGGVELEEEVGGGGRVGDEFGVWMYKVCELNFGSYSMDGEGCVLDSM